jgi:HTH-type transcriptional regulator / antitoxin HigA
MASLNLPAASAPHPGETVLDYLEFNAWSQRDLARRTGISPKTISEICNGKAPISPPTSLALEKVFRRPAHFWMNLQARFDEAQARQRERERSAEWKTWGARFPLREMKRRGWLPGEPRDGAAATALLRFLGVSSPESWNAVWSAAQVSYRQTRKFKKSIEAISAWVRATELAAEEIAVGAFDEHRLRASLDDLRSCTRLSIDEALSKATEICRVSGVAVVLVPELPNTGISGCARWLSDSYAILALTLRYKSDDQVWFTFFHELGHILLHRRKHRFILDNADVDLTDRIVDPEMQVLEDQANRFAADTLIPPRELAAFIGRRDLTSESIHGFSEAIGVGPGIVVGRLQHEEVLAAHQGNALKQRVRWSLSEDE